MEQETKRKQIIKKIASIFLIVMLILTFFSNTIMNYSLPEVATEVVTGGTVSNKVRGQGTVETNSNYEVMVSGTRVIKEVKVEVGDTVEKGQVLFTFEEGENTELAEAQDLLDQMELDYAKSMLKMAPDCVWQVKAKQVRMAARLVIFILIYAFVLISDSIVLEMI